MARRRLLRGAGAALVLGTFNACSLGKWNAKERGTAALKLAPIRAQLDRVMRVTVCTRPFRAQGPRLDVESVGNKTVVHNYGHGGSGWSLSWGSSAIAIAKAMATGERNVGVIGCGALGMTSALLLQRAGASVTIYAKELPPYVRSSLATGLWTPDSRICLEEHATPAFKQSWQQMARYSFESYQSFLGLPGTPVEFIDSYFVSDDPANRRRSAQPDDRPAFAELQRELISDLIPHSVDFEPGTHSLGQRYLRRNSQLMFNLSAYTRTLLADFTGNGGKIEIADFHVPADLARVVRR